MKIAVLDSTAVVASGPGSPAYFSRFVIQRLRQQGHEVLISPGFDESLCSEADLVWTEWANQEAFEAAASGICKRLVVRVRGFDAHGPLDKLRWDHVDAVVFESAFLRDFVEIERGIMSIHHSSRVTVLPSGIDIANIQYLRRNNDVGPVVALVARTTSDKGYQLAFEWARQRPEVRLHVTTALAETSPRLAAYLEHTRPVNVTIHGTVDTTKWLNEIGATHLISCSIWETLGYTIVEGMAVGCKPLIHNAPGTSVNWPAEYLWTSFDDLDKLLYGSFESDNYRDYAEKHFDERVLSQQFIDLVTNLPAREVPNVIERRYAYEHEVLKLVGETQADVTKDVRVAAAAAEDYRRRWPAHDRFGEFRYGVATTMASAYGKRHDLESAAVWACRAMLDAPWPDAFAIMGEVAAERGDAEQAAEWYAAACAVDDPPRRLRMDELIERSADRRRELTNTAYPGVALASSVHPPERFAIVVTVRNAVKWISECLGSIALQQQAFTCLVIDDMSMDGTAEVAEACIQKLGSYFSSHVRIIRNTERKYQARNTVEGARLVTSNPEDVVVLIDGDDWLENPEALDVIAKAYDRGAWMTYGNFVTSSGKRSHIGPYPQRIAREGNFREWSWQATAPRTFKRFLLDYLTDDDFKANGEWPKVAGDVSIMLPLLELACERAVAITDPIYVYNDETPDSDHKQDAREQVRVRDVLMERPKKSRLERP